MKAIFKRWEFWALLIVIIIALYQISTWVKSTNVDGSEGGVLNGPSHANGGIPGVIKETGERISVEGNEAIINKTSLAITDEYVCSGTPNGIVSAVNELGGGVKFGEGGTCNLK